MLYQELECLCAMGIHHTVHEMVLAPGPRTQLGPCYCSWPIHPSGGSPACPKFQVCELVTHWRHFLWRVGGARQAVYRYVCVCVRVCACVCARVCARVCVHVHACVCVHAYVCVHTCVHMRVCACMCVCVCVLLCVCVHVCVCVCACMYASVSYAIHCTYVCSYNWQLFWEIIILYG